MISAQDKILYVANKLGLSTLKDMQASTGAVYDVDIEQSGVLFSNAARHAQPGATNINENQFEVNEALLIESLAFYDMTTSEGQAIDVLNFQNFYGSDTVIVFDLVIGNKRVLKDTPIFAAGTPYTFATTGLFDDGAFTTFKPRHQLFMEGAGILIPPQVQFYISYKLYNVITGATEPYLEDHAFGCYLFGTRVLLNFNTTI
jgi:hypothetical protein